MLREEREMVCRRCAGGQAGPNGPFVLTGARPYYTPDRVCDVEHIRVEVALDFERAQVAGTCTLTLAPLNDGDTRLLLDAVEMEIASVAVDGKPHDFGYDGRQLAVALGERTAGERLELAVRYRCTPRRGLYFIRPDRYYPERPTQAWSQGQDEDNRCWFPCFDHPNEKSTSEVIATVPEKMTVVSNGKLVEIADGAGVRTFHFRHDVPHASYLITLVAGEYVELTDAADGTVLRYLVPAGREEDARRAFGKTPEMVRLFAERTGQPYPYPSYTQVTVAEFIFGGMENTSATTLTDQTLHDARAHIDFSSEPLVAHELAHQWFGDLLTCRDWAQAWLNEGFATYFEIVWREHIEGADAADYDRLIDQEAYFDEDDGRYRRPIVANVFHAPIDVFDRHLYEKGGAVLHMLRRHLGEARFWKAIRHYVKKHAFGSVETRDLARAVDEATGVNVDRFFDQWVFRAGYPDLKVDVSWDDEHKLARVHVKQAQEIKEGDRPFAFTLPVRFVVGGVEQDVPLAVDEVEQTFVVPLAAKPTQAVIDPGNHLVKRLDAKKPDELWHGELQSARHAIDRVRAARALGKAGDATALAPLQKALAGDPFWAVRGEAALALGQLRSEAARAAIAAALPTEKHAKARRQMVRALGQFRGDAAAAEAAARVLAGDASYFVEAEAATALGKIRAPGAFELIDGARGRPSYLDVIRAACIGALAELRDERAVAVALAEAKRGNPPPSRRAAFTALGLLGDEFAAHKRRALEALTEALDDPDFRARIAAVEALRTLGDRRALGALGRAAESDLDGRVRRRAREVARTLSEGLRAEEKLSTLREQVEKLRDESDKLRERVLKLEVTKK